MPPGTRCLGHELLSTSFFGSLAHICRVWFGVVGWTEGNLSQNEEGAYS